MRKNLHRALIGALIVAIVCMVLTFVFARMPSISLELTQFVFLLEKIAIGVAIVLFLARYVFKARRPA